LFRCQFKDSSNKDVSTNAEILEINRSSIQDKYPLSKYVADVSYIQLDTNKNTPLVGQVDKIEIIDNKIYILDASIAKALFIFEINGKFLHKIGRLGEGPGEIEEIYDFQVEKIDKNGRNLIYLKDSKKLLIYDDTGKFIREEKVPLSGQFVKARNFYLFKTIDNDLTLTTDDFTIKKEFFPINQIYPVALSQSFSKLPDGRHLYRHSLCDTIFEVTQWKYEPYRIVKFSNGLDANEYKEYIQSKKRINSPKMYGIKHYFETNNVVYLTFRYQNIMYISLVNKKNQEIQSFPFNISNDITFEEACPLVIGYYNESFISILQPNDIRLNSLDHNNKFVEKLLNNLRSLDVKHRVYNPLVSFITYK
jgi:hypothetical protein